MKIIFVIELKKHIIGTYIFDIIINKFSYWHKIGLIILSEINKNSEIHFYYIILTFDMAVNLKIKDN